MMDSGKVFQDKVMEFKHGQTEQDMKGNGLITKHREEVNLYMLIMISMMGNGKMIKLMVMVYMCILMVQDMKAIGKMIIKMDTENNNGLMEAHILENINKAKNMGKELINGEIRVILKGNG
jgi:hypothetical protein